MLIDGQPLPTTELEKKNSNNPIFDQINEKKEDQKE